MHRCAYIYIYIYMFILYVYVRIHRCISIRVYIYIYITTYTYIYMCIYTHRYMCMCICRSTCFERPYPSISYIICKYIIYIYIHVRMKLSVTGGCAKESARGYLSGCARRLERVESRKCSALSHVIVLSPSYFGLGHHSVHWLH